MPLIAFDQPVWRLVPAIYSGTPAAPARAPEGRFHHGDQTATYASLTATGAGVAMQRYLGDGIARVMVPMHLTATRVVDHRGNRDLAIVWQDIRAGGAVSPTWAFSDAARAAGAQAMIYPCRTRHDLSHVVIFEPACLRRTGADMPFP